MARSLRICFVFCALGTLGCRDPAPASPPVSTPASAPAPVSAPVLEAADPWVRRPVGEPHPEARALYRRAVQLVHEGKPAEAEALFSKISETWGDTRFAARLRTEGLSEALLGQAAAMGVGLLAVAVYAGLIDLGKP